MSEFVFCLQCARCLKPVDKGTEEYIGDEPFCKECAQLEKLGA